MKFSRLFFIILPLLYFSSFISRVDAQTVKLNEKISFSINNASVSDALDALSRVTGATFSYNPDQLHATRNVKVDMRDRQLIEVLDAILGPAKFGYRLMGNQIIIYKNKPEGDESPNDVDSNENLTESENRTSGRNRAGIAQQKPDTVYLLKEVHDTVRVTDVVVKTDTIYEKVVTPVSRGEIFRVVLAKEMTAAYKMDVGITAGILQPMALFSAHNSYSQKLEQFRESYSNKSFSATMGFDLRLSKRKWTAGTGLHYTIFGQKLDYTYQQQEGGYFRKDTLDPYYTLSDGDTTWYYIVDSTYIPIDNKLYNYKINNHVKYFEIPLVLQRNWGYRSMLFYIRGGIIPGFHLGSTGQQILAEENGVIALKEIRAKSVVLSYTAGVGAAFPLGRKAIFNAALYYRNHFSSIYKDFPIETRFSALGLSAGLIYKLY